jgi:hypothetical protein
MGATPQGYAALLCPLFEPCNGRHNFDQLAVRHLTTLYPTLINTFSLMTQGTFHVAHGFLASFIPLYLSSTSLAVIVAL